MATGYAAAVTAVPSVQSHLFTAASAASARASHRNGRRDQELPELDTLGRGCIQTVTRFQ